MRTIRLTLPAAAITAIAAASLGTAAPALADCSNGVFDEPVPVTALSPADNASMEQTYVRPVRFTLISPLYGGVFFVRVAFTPKIGVDGLLSDLDTIDSAALVESRSDPSYYSGTSGSTASSLTDWTNVPGTYYWQLSGTWSVYGECHLYAGPVNTITVTASPPSTPSQPTQPPPAPPPTPPTSGSPPAAPPGAPASPPISAAQGPAYAARMVRARTGRHPHITVSCLRTNVRTLRCALRWTAAGVSYVADGRFTRPAAPAGTRIWRYDFTGTRAWRTCKRLRECSTRTARFHWVGHS